MIEQMLAMGLPAYQEWTAPFRGIDHEGEPALRAVRLFAPSISRGPCLKGDHLNSVATLLPLPESVGVPPSTPTIRLRDIPDALQRACLAAQTAADNKAQDIAILDLRKVTPIFDFFVIATGTSRRQIHTIVEEIDATMRRVGDTRTGVEGYESSKWVVQDYGDVLVHVFDAETRSYYNLEELWADAVKLDWEQELD